MHLLTLTLDLPLQPWQITNLRAAVVERVGKEHELFHMHNNDPKAEGHFHRHYPLVQYSIQEGRAQILGINEGAEAIRYALLPKMTPQWTIAGQSFRIRNFHVHQEEVELVLGEKPHVFGLYRWMGLHKNNYQLWREAREEPDTRRIILNRALTGHLRALAEGIGLPHYKAVTGKVREVLNCKKVSWHGVPLTTFHVIAESNLKAPDRLCLGRLGAYGFGTITPPEELLQQSRIKSHRSGKYSRRRHSD